METLVIYPTATAQWHALINDAEYKCAAHLGEDLQSYLVFLLMRYLGASELAASILALEYLNGLEMNGHLREAHLRDVGDKCLLFSGLFPGQAERRRVRISYYVDLGVSAYATLANSLAGVKANLFQALSKQFVAVMDVLQATRELGTNLPALQPLQAMELWNDTNSAHALATLGQYTDAVPVRVAPTLAQPHYKSVSQHTVLANVH